MVREGLGNVVVVEENSTECCLSNSVEFKLLLISFESCNSDVKLKDSESTWTLDSRATDEVPGPKGDVSDTRFVTTEFPNEPEKGNSKVETSPMFRVGDTGDKPMPSSDISGFGSLFVKI